MLTVCTVPSPPHLLALPCLALGGLARAVLWPIYSIGCFMTPLTLSNQERVLVAARLWAGGIRAEYLATDALVRWVIDGDSGMQM